MTPDQRLIDTIKKKLKRLFTSPKPYMPVRILKRGSSFHLILQQNSTATPEESTVTSIDGFSFQSSARHTPYIPLKGFPCASEVEGVLHDKKRVMYFGDRYISVAYSTRGSEWVCVKKPVIASSRPVELGEVFVEKKALLLLYFEKKIENGVLLYSAFMAFVNKKNPEEVLWKSPLPLWKQEDLWPHKTIKPIGSVMHNGVVICYWDVENEGIYGVVLSGFLFDPNLLGKKKLKLNKHITNPILAPNAENNWEAFNTFNPAAVSVGGKVHILYRAQGYDYVSTVGYASSVDGIAIDERLNVPIYTPSQGFENNLSNGVSYDYISGGGYGGCEDPRVTLLGDSIYMTYVAFDGWSPPRLALTSILVDDFLSKRWNWTKPVLISRPGIVDKSGCILPEKIKGKFVFFHRVFPNILIDYVDNLNFDGKTNWLKGEYSIKIRPDKWDSRKIGAGAPPIKTKDGWLLIYYGVDDKDAGKYHIGAMILDLENPTKVLYRCDEPILGPTEEYENSGFKPGVAYPCGAVVKDNELLVYYGGADSVVCVATAHLDTFLEELKSKKPVHLHTVSIREVTY